MPPSRVHGNWLISAALKPEKSWNGNLNYTGFIAFKKGYISLAVNGFFTYFSNQIVGDFISNPSQIIYKNLNGYAISGGMNANLEASFHMGSNVIEVHLSQLRKKLGDPDLIETKVGLGYYIQGELIRS